MMEPLVSIICTVKNGEATLPAAIDSVISQTYQRWELIIMDDGSTDGSLFLAHQYAEKEPRIKVYKAENRGRAKALNEGVRHSQGQYIAILDADDLFHPQKLQYQVEVFLKEEPFFLLATEGLLIIEDEKPFWEAYKQKASISIIDEKLNLRNTIIHSSVLLERKALFELGLYNASRNRQIDYELWLRALAKNYGMRKLLLPLTAKRIHKNQSFENKKRLRYVWSSARLQWKFLIKNHKFLWLPIPFFTFLYGLLPLSLRKRLMKLRKAKY